MSAHLCAAIPNFRIMELRPDEAPWTRDFLTHPSTIENGEIARSLAPRLGLRHRRRGAEGAPAPAGAIGSVDARRLLGTAAARQGDDHRCGRRRAGSRAAVVETLPELLAALNGADALILYDAPPEAGAAGRRRPVGAGQHRALDAFPHRGPRGLRRGRPAARVAVTYPAGCVAPTVAEHAMTLLLALVRRVPAMLEEQAKRNWSRLAVSARADLGRRQGDGHRRLRPDRPRGRAARPALRHQDHRGLAHAPSPTRCWTKAIRCPSWIRRSRAPTS